MSMIRSNQKELDAKGIIKFFGGKHAIVEAYNKQLKSVITIKAIEKWEERKAIALKHIVALEEIAKKNGKIFEWRDYLK